MPGRIPGNTHCSCLQGISNAPSVGKSVGVSVFAEKLQDASPSRALIFTYLGTLQAQANAHVCKASVQELPNLCSSIHREPGFTARMEISVHLLQHCDQKQGGSTPSPRSFAVLPFKKSHPGRDGSRPRPWQPLGSVCVASARDALHRAQLCLRSHVSLQAAADRAMVCPPRMPRGFSH